MELRWSCEGSDKLLGFTGLDILILISPHKWQRPNHKRREETTIINEHSSATHHGQHPLLCMKYIQLSFQDEELPATILHTLNQLNSMGLCPVSPQSKAL